jgi:hypothetical protein
MMETLLIFPAGMPRSLAYLRRAIADNANVVGASSLDYDPSHEHYPAWAHLPYVTDCDFDIALTALITECGVTQVFTPHPVVWQHLQEALPRIAPSVRLANDRPEQEEMAPYRQARQLARQWATQPLEIASTVPELRRQLTEIEAAALAHQFGRIPGQCDFIKLQALAEVARRCPAGDLVEVGSLWGKSAFALNWLAVTYRIGKLLCVDPWTSGDLVQNDPGGAVDRFSAQLDPDEALDVFRINLLAVRRGSMNYLRMRSVDAARRCREKPWVATPEFGRTHYRRSIALLHIDGNHQYEAACADLREWTPMVRPGGWIVIDDYVWPFGDGPRRAGDQFLEAVSPGNAFVAGGALFLQLRARSS